jgi:hypothetical protein
MRIIAFFFLLAMISGCSDEGLKTDNSLDDVGNPEESSSPLPSNMKGYELYSWSTKGRWNYTLITGTNRIKTYDEIVAKDNIEREDGWVKITVNDVSRLKKLLGRIPSGQHIGWMPSTTWLSGFSYPSVLIVQEGEKYCVERDLNLMIIK